jgi:Cu/Ag efflux protein CusF
MKAVMRTHHAPRALLAALIVAAAACGGSSSTEPVTSGVPEGVYDIRGSVVSIDRPRNIVEINHEAIPGVMPAMTMPYEVSDPGLLQGLSVGDRIRGTLRVDGRGYVITALTRT